MTEAAKSQTGGKGIAKTCTTMRKGMEMNKNIGRKSFHHFVQRLLVRSVRQQVAKPQVLMTSHHEETRELPGERNRLWLEHGNPCASVYLNAHGKFRV